MAGHSEHRETYPLETRLAVLARIVEWANKGIEHADDDWADTAMSMICSMSHDDCVLRGLWVDDRDGR